MRRFILIVAFIVLMPLAWCRINFFDYYERFAAGERKFSVSFLKSLNEYQRGNLIFSPHSIYSALTLAYLGANGKTKESLEEVLHLKDRIGNKKEAHELYLRNKQYHNESYGFNTVDKLYIKPGVELL